MLGAGHEHEGAAEIAESEFLLREYFLDARQRFGGLRLNSRWRGDATVCIRGIDAGEKKPIADAHAVAAGADG